MVKKIFLLLSSLLFILLNGCNYKIELTGEYKTLEELNIFTYTNIEYLLDTSKDYFQSPKETMELCEGDCEDYTIMLMFLANKDLNIKPDMQIVFIDNMGYHALAYYNNVYYDPTNNHVLNELPMNWTKIIRWDYDFIMLYATDFYTKGIYE